LPSNEGAIEGAISYLTEQLIVYGELLHDAFNRLYGFGAYEDHGPLVVERRIAP
jgi:hypothetical protein